MDCPLAENAKRLYDSGHPWAEFALDCAGKTGTAAELYLDQGQWAALAYAMTGDPAYAAKAVAKILPFVTKDPANANVIREWMIDFALWYGWLAPALTPLDDAAYRVGLDRWCEWCFAVKTRPYVGGWRVEDTDQTVGQFFGVAVADQYLGAGWATRDPFPKVRGAVRRYCEWAAGGEWVESESYNLGTVKLLLSGAYGAGIDEFPDVAAVVPELARQQLANLTPDFKDSYKWGDEEHAGDPMLYKRVPLLAALAGLTGDPEVHAAVGSLTAGLRVRDYLFLGWKALYFYRPPAAPARPGYLRFGGNGHFRYRRAGALFGCHFPDRLKVDHEVNAFGDFRLYLDGEWVISHPLGYGGEMVEGTGCNAALLAGLSSMAGRGAVSYEETAGGCRVVGRTSGAYYPPPYWDAPPAFADWTRELTYAFPGRVEVRDVFAGNPPARVERYRAADQKRIAGAGTALWQQVFHCPAEPTGTEAGFEWGTAGGKTVRLTAPAGATRLVTPERDVLGGGPPTYVKPEQLAGYQIRFASAEPACEMVTVLEVT